VLTHRGMVLAAGSVILAVAGLAYGVEEFVMVAASVAVLLALGAVSVRVRRRRARRGLRMVTSTPQIDLSPGQAAVVELTVANAGRRHLPSVVVGDPARCWAVSYPGLSGSALATGRRAPGPGRGLDRDVAARPGGGAPAEVAADPTGGLASGLAGPPRRGTRRQRARDRRAVAGGTGLPPLAPGASVVVSFPVPATTRGLLTLSGVSVWCQDPFGLGARRVGTAPVAHVIVFPVPAAADRSAHDRGRRAGRHPDAGAAAPTNALAGDELQGLRPYAPGDRLSRLHWPSLARSGDIMVREFVAPDSATLSLLVDLRPASHAGDSIEHAIAQAAGLGVRALDDGVTVELCTSTGESMVIAPGAAARPALLRALALLGPAGAPPAAARRWGDRPTGGAVWATAGDDIVLVTTAAGAAAQALPDSVRRQADTVLVR